MFSLQLWQMYIRGKLLFLGFIFSAQSRTEKDLLKEISRVRGDYRLGLSLPSDYKYRYSLCRDGIFKFNLFKQSKF